MQNNFNNSVINNFNNINNISSYDFYKFYKRTSRYLGIIWFFLTLAFTIIIIIVFLSQNWIGDTNESSNKGHFGLYSFCSRNRLATKYNCSGSLDDFSSFPSDTCAFKASTFFIGLTCLISLIAISFIALCILIKYERVFHICAWLQCLCTASLLLGVIIFPIGWNSKTVRLFCGNQADQFNLGRCSIGWPYILACMAILKIFLITILGFLLASRQAKFILNYSVDKNLTK